MSFKNICPHCGFKSFDDEICNSCGKTLHNDDCVQKKSFRQVVREVGVDLKNVGICDGAITAINNCGLIDFNDPAAPPCFGE